MTRMSKLLAISRALAIPAIPAEEESQLFQAIRKADIAFVKTHLTKVEIEVRDRRGATPLMHAAAFGNLESLGFCSMRAMSAPATISTRPLFCRALAIPTRLDFSLRAEPT